MNIEDYNNLLYLFCKANHACFDEGFINRSEVPEDCIFEFKEKSRKAKDDFISALTELFASNGIFIINS
jgi:hypothetical protein